MYNFENENDKEFLREAVKLLQDKLIVAELKLIQAKIENSLDEEMLKKLSEELKNLRKRVFASQQERKANKPRNQKKCKKSNLPHNKSSNEKLEDLEIELDEKVIEYKIDDGRCPSCGGDKFSEMKNCFEE
jgi:hypothetical protein